MDYILMGYASRAAIIAAREGWKGLEKTFRQPLLVWLVSELRLADELPEAWESLREEIAKAALQGRPWALR